ncbi:MAG: Sec-independent protein translocase protein TatB [Pseudomonadota bacterium]
MFGIDSPELLIIAIVALIVIGPKELPNLLRSWGRWMAQMRGMASEFRGHVDEMVRQSELDEVKKQLESAPGLDLQALDPTKQIKSAIQEGMAEGEKALADARSTLDNPLAEPESAPQVAAEPQAAIEPLKPETAAVETAASEPAAGTVPPPATPVAAAEAPAPLGEAAKPSKVAAAE